MMRLEGFFRPVAMMQDDDERLAGPEIFHADNLDAVFFTYFIVISLAGKGNGQHPLFLQIGFVYAGEAFSQDYLYIQETGLHGCMFARGAFAVIFLGHHDGKQSSFLILSGHRRDGAVQSRNPVQHRVGFAVKSIDGAHQHISGDIFQVSAKTKPRPGH